MRQGIILTALAAAVFAVCATNGYAQAQEKIGKRPYEMDWAGRTEEVRTPLVDFENLDGWTVTTVNAVATFERSREEQMYGDYVGKLVYRCDDPSGSTPIVEIRPKKPIPFTEKDVDAYSMWVVGNNWGWTVDPSTPRVRIMLIFADASGKETDFHSPSSTGKNGFSAMASFQRI